MHVEGAKVRRLRELKGVTLPDFAERVGISRQYLSDIERDQRKLSRRPDLIVRMAKLLRVPVRDITSNGAA